jgi:hypothetical protein
MTDRPVFLTRAQAEQMARGVEESFFERLGTTKAGFIKGEAKAGAMGLVWRHPTMMQTSAQPAEYYVVGKEAKAVAEPLAYVPVKYADVTIPGMDKPQRFQIGMAPGMKLDFDKDMIMSKFFVDEASMAKMVGTKEEWRALERNYEKHILDRQILSKAMSKRMRDVAVEQATSATEVAEFKKAFDVGGEELYRKALGAHRLATGKDVGALSKVMEEIMFAVGSRGRDPEMTALLNVILSEAEETGTLKARKAPGLVKVSEDIVAAFRRKSTGDVEAVLNVIHDELMGRDFLKHASYTYEGEPRAVKSVDEIFDYTIKNYNEYVSDAGGRAQQMFRAIFTGRDVPMQMKIEAYNTIMTGTDVSPMTAYFASLRGNMAGKWNIMSEFGISAANVDNITMGAQKAWQSVTKHIPGPMLLGLLGSAAAFSVMGGPGYAEEPLGPPGVRAPLNPVMAAISGGAVQPQIEDMLPRGGGPSVTGQLMTPAAPITPMANQVSISIPGRDMIGLDYNGIGRALRTILPNSNLTSRLLDERRPLSPNDLYRDGF